MLPIDAAARKAIPVYSGFVKYFPRAICSVAYLSKVGNDQHNPGQSLHWAKEKSQDELDALMRHLIDDVLGVPTDTDGIDHLTKVAWRAMANLERALEKKEKVQVEVRGKDSRSAISNESTLSVRSAEIKVSDGENLRAGLDITKRSCC